MFDLIDLRKELQILFHDSCSPRSQKAVLRRMRRDNNNNLIACSCIGKLSNFPNLHHGCPRCLGEGYIWDEVWTSIWRFDITRNPEIGDKFLPIGEVRNLDNIIYIESKVRPSRYDKIIELALDDNGNPEIPYKRIAIYKIVTPVDLRERNGRIEFYRLVCRTQTDRDD